MSGVRKPGLFTFTEKEKAAIKSACETVSDDVAKCRLEVLRLYADGKTYAEITSATKYSESSIGRILHRYKADGLVPIANESLTGKRKYTAVNCEFTPEQIAELQEGYMNASKPHVAKRFRALLLRSEGKTLEELVKDTHFSQGNLSRLLKAYREEGVQAVIGKPRPSRTVKYDFTEEQKHEIEEARKMVTDGGTRTRKRLEALFHRAEGKTLEEAAVAAGLHPKTVMVLVQKYQENGLDGIIKDGSYKQGNSSRNRYLSYGQESSVLEQFRLKAEQGQQVTVIDIKAVLECKIGRTVSDEYVKQVLRRHNWTQYWMPPEKG